MKRLIQLGLLGTGLLLSTTGFTATSQFPCDHTIVSATTDNNKKEMKICMSGGKVALTFGNIGATKPEIDIIVPVSQTGYNHWAGGSLFTVDDGPHHYYFQYVSGEGALNVEKEPNQVDYHPVEKVITDNIGNAKKFGIKLRDFGY